MRLDVCVAQSFGISREKAQGWIKNKNVKVGDRLVCKPSFGVCANDEVSVVRADCFVGRGALKLLGFLESHRIVVPHRSLDIGSSTGGFVQALLHKGAREVVCVDVGKAQLHKTLLEDRRVVVFEQTDIRDFDSSPFLLVTCDVSFISLRAILPSVARLCLGEAIVLFKPQFEVGRGARRNKKGVVVDEHAIKKAREEIVRLCVDLGFRVHCVQPCCIAGKEGNAESFIHLFR